MSKEPKSKSPEQILKDFAEFCGFPAGEIVEEDGMLVTSWVPVAQVPVPKKRRKK